MRAAELLEACDTLIEDIKRGAVAEAKSHVVTEGNPWHSRNLVTSQKLVAKVSGLQPDIGAVHKEVKCSARLNNAHVWNRFQAAEHELTADIIFTTKI